ncbi:MAG: hypothetical protein PHD81_03885 [Candidatus Nanoarchaeia archaeon]|nr:hypothetical protein [Candidatus Nanoarchaeia archaeon]MDD5588223.1 hypothetical protein [Candidatus Nanoarchaeia archaeon]
MVTTIQLRENVKDSLNKMKEKENETYEEVILKMMHNIEDQKRKQKQLLKEGYIEMAKETISLHKEWSLADKDWD